MSSAEHDDLKHPCHPERARDPRFTARAPGPETRIARFAREDKERGGSLGTTKRARSPAVSYRATASRAAAARSSGTRATSAISAGFAFRNVQT